MNALQGMNRYWKEVIQVSKYKECYTGSVYLYDTRFKWLLYFNVSQPFRDQEHLQIKLSKIIQFCKIIIKLFTKRCWWFEVLGARSSGCKTYFCFLSVWATQASLTFQLYHLKSWKHWDSKLWLLELNLLNCNRYSFFLSFFLSFWRLFSGEF